MLSIKQRATDNAKEIVKMSTFLLFISSVIIGRMASVSKQLILISSRPLSEVLLDKLKMSTQAHCSSILNS